MAAVVMDSTTLSLLRREDMLLLDMRFTNVSLTQGGSGPPVLVATDPSAPALVQVEFPPQAMAEQTYPGGDVTPGIGTADPTDARFSGPSRITFRIMPSTSLTFTAAGLLAWTGLIGVTERTGIECVWSLIARPAFGPHDTWLHASVPVVTPDGVTGLWHTRMTRRTATGAPDVTTRNPLPITMSTNITGSPPFITSLAGQSANIAALSASQPVEAHQLTLSALGASVDLHGDWTNFGYRHRASTGRDQTVQITAQGLLMPFRFPAVVNQCTERGGAHTTATTPGFPARGSAALITTARVTIRSPEVSYDDAQGMPHACRGFPFRSVRVSEALTFEMAPVARTDQPFWVDDPSGGHHLLRLTGLDYEGNTTVFAAPVRFVPDGVNPALDTYNPPNGNLIYSSEKNTSRPATGRLALAFDSPSAAPVVGPGKSCVDLTAVYVDAERDAMAEAVFPVLAGVEARIPAVDAFSGTAPAHGTSHPQLTLDQTYVRGGFSRDPRNPAKLSGPGIFAVLQPAVPFTPPPSSVGGLTAFAIQATGLSLGTGLVGGDLDAFRANTFDPATFFAGAPKLLGFLPLTDIVEKVIDPDLGDRAPRVHTEVIFPPGGVQAKPPQAVRATVTWRPTIKAALPGVGLTTDPAATTLDLTSEITTDLGTGQAVSSVHGELRKFGLSFIDDLLIVNFERLAFSSNAGAPLTVDVKIANVTLGDSPELQFINRLLSQLHTPSNGPRVIYHDNEVEVDYTLALPAVEMGVFLMQNLAVSAGVILPLDGRRVGTKFAVSSRENPFLLTVSLFGGGGFLALEFEGGSVKQLEFQIDFGAATALDLGVASAAVSVTAGIHILLKDRKPDLTGFFRAVGQVDVLGVIGVSIELYMALTIHGSRVTGTAAVTVRVHVLFFAQSVTFHVSRSFGGGADPSFVDMFPDPGPWQQHCAAFAPMGGS